LINTEIGAIPQAPRSCIAAKEIPAIASQKLHPTKQHLQSRLRCGAICLITLFVALYIQESI
jgi:hypothetical protein